MNEDDNKAISKVGEDRWVKFKQLQEKRLQLSKDGNKLNHKKQKTAIQQTNTHTQQTKIKKETSVSASNTPLSKFLDQDDDHRFEDNSKVCHVKVGTD